MLNLKYSTMKKQVNYFIALMILAVFMSCESGMHAENELLTMKEDIAEEAYYEGAADIVDEEGIEMTEVSETEQQPPKPTSTVVFHSKNISQIIKKANISLSVDDYVKARKSIREFTKEYQAYVSDESETRTAYSVENYITIRVPNPYFEDLMENLSAIPGEILSRNVETEDVTQEFVDTKARIKAMRELETRYYALLKNAKNMEEVLRMEDYIRTVHADIESMEGRLRYLKDKVSYSTVDVHLQQYFDMPVAEAETPGFLAKAGDAFIAGWSGIITVIIGLLYIWPIIIIAIIATYIILYFEKKRAAKKRNKAIA